MSLSTPEHRVSEEKLLHSGRRTIPQKQSTDNIPRGESEHAGADIIHSRRVEIRTALPDIDVISGHTQQALRHIFKPGVQWNDKCLEIAFINRHPFSHMDRVATGVYQLGKRLSLKPEDLAVVTLATRLHDIGYNFPQNVSERKIVSIGKDMHKVHSQRGADMFTDAFIKLRKNDSRVAQETEWWTDEHTEMAHQAIRLHSNDSSVTSDQIINDPSIHTAALLPRLIDKLDNISARIYPSHMDTLASAPLYSIQGIRQCVKKKGTKQGIIQPAKRHFKSPKEVLESIMELDSRPYHRLAPYAITDQTLYVDSKDASMVVQYHVHPTDVASKLQTTYTDTDHLRDFTNAYDRSMCTAAVVIHALRKRLFEIDDPKAPLLCASLSYEDGQHHEVEYPAA